MSPHHSAVKRKGCDPLIYMVRSDEEDVDYESNWATLTFEVK